MKSRVEKKIVPNLHFWVKRFGHFDDLQSNLFFPRSIRIDFSRSVIFNLVRRVLQEEIHFFIRKTQKTQLFSAKKRQNRSKLEKSPSRSKSGPRKKFRMTFFIHRSSGYWILNTKSSIFNMICTLKKKCKKHAVFALFVNLTCVLPLIFDLKK